MKIFEPGKKSFTLFVVVISVILLIGIPAASAAFTAALTSGTTAYPGDTVSLTITGLSVNDVFNIQLRSTDLVATGSTVTLSTFNMPFSFNTDKSTVNLTTTTATAGVTTLSVSESGASALSKTSGAAALVNSINTTKTITAQPYDITISSTSVSSGSTVGINYVVNGSVLTNPSPAYLNFTIKGVSSGNVDILVNEGVTNRLTTQINIVAVRPAPIPTPTGASSEGGGGGGAAPSGPAAPAAPVAPQVVVAPQAVVVASLQTVTVPTGAGGTFAADTNVDVGSGTVSISGGTTVLTSAGNPVTNVRVTYSPLNIYSEIQNFPSIHLNNPREYS